MGHIRQAIASAQNNDLTLVERAKQILLSTHESAQAFLQAFDEVSQARGDSDGATDAEQDLLRAMLVFSAAGLDATIKQIVREALPKLVETDEGVRQGLETFVSRQIRSDGDSGASSVSHKFLARLLVANSLQKQVVSEYVNDLTGKSMQSVEELMRATYALGIEPSDCYINAVGLKPIFEIRNRIIHELDISLGEPPRRRNEREREDMVEKANLLLLIGESLLTKVASKLQSLRNSTDENI